MKNKKNKLIIISVIILVVIIIGIILVSDNPDNPSSRTMPNSAITIPTTPMVTQLFRVIRRFWAVICSLVIVG